MGNNSISQRGMLRKVQFLVLLLFQAPLIFKLTRSVLFPWPHSVKLFCTFVIQSDYFVMFCILFWDSQTQMIPYEFVYSEAHSLCREDLSFDKCIVSCMCYPSIVQNSFNALKYLLYFICSVLIPSFPSWQLTSTILKCLPVPEYI